MEDNITNRKGNLKLKIDASLVAIIVNTLKCILLFSLSIFLNLSQIYAANQKTIAITEIVNHPSLIEAKKGILDELKDNGYEEGKNLKIIYQNAQGSIANAALIAKHFFSLKPDAIVPISTASAQAILTKAQNNSDIPIVFSSVTDPVAAGLVHDLSTAEYIITGAIDSPPIKEEIELIKTILPNIQRLGLLYNSGETNSLQTIKLIKDAIGNQLTIIEATPTSTNNVAEAVKYLIGKVDAIYVPSDNVVFSALPKVIELSLQYKIPVFSSDPDSVREGFLACVGYTQYEVGKTAGKLLVKILNGDKFLKVQKPKQYEIVFNKVVAEKMGIKIPKLISGSETKIIE